MFSMLPISREGMVFLQMSLYLRKALLYTSFSASHYPEDLPSHMHFPGTQLDFSQMLLHGQGMELESKYSGDFSVKEK